MIRTFLMMLFAAVMVSACEPVNDSPYAPRDAQSATAGGSGIHVGSQRPPLPAPPGARRDLPTPLQDGGTRIKVGLLLPITGRNDDLGRALQDAATLSLFDKYATLAPQKVNTRVELVPYDTGDTPEQARVAARQAVKDGVVLLIGPVFSDATQAVTPIAQEAGLSVLSFSNNITVAQPGVYLFGFSPEAQTRRVVGYAATQGRNQLAALVPNSAYGQAVLDAARSTVTGKGGALVTQALYSPQGVGVENSVGMLIPEGRPPAFDSLLLPEGGTPLATLLRSLRNRGVDGAGVKLLGTGLWDDPSLLSRVNLEGSWFATSPPHLTYAFEKRFMSTYDYQPPRIASLAYDAVALAVTIVTSGRSFNEVTLTGPTGFSGPANGIFRFLKNGVSERGLAVLEVRGGSFDVVSPAPTSFVQ